MKKMKIRHKVTAMIANSDLNQSIPVLKLNYKHKKKVAYVLDVA